jgi:hypothetical protein
LFVASPQHGRHHVVALQGVEPKETCVAMGPMYHQSTRLGPLDHLLQEKRSKELLHGCYKVFATFVETLVHQG